MNALDFETFIEENLVTELERRIVHNLASFTKLLEDRLSEMSDLVIKNKVNALMTKLNKSVDNHQLNLREILPEEYSYHFHTFKI